MYSLSHVRTERTFSVNDYLSISVSISACACVCLYPCQHLYLYPRRPLSSSLLFCFVFLCCVVSSHNVVPGFSLLSSSSPPRQTTSNMQFSLLVCQVCTSQTKITSLFATLHPLYPRGRSCSCTFSRVPPQCLETLHGEIRVPDCSGSFQTAIFVVRTRGSACANHDLTILALHFRFRPLSP